MYTRYCMILAILGFIPSCSKAPDDKATLRQHEPCRGLERAVLALFDHTRQVLPPVDATDEGVSNVVKQVLKSDEVRSLSISDVSSVYQLNFGEFMILCRKGESGAAEWYVVVANVVDDHVRIDAIVMEAIE